MAIEKNFKVGSHGNLLAKPVISVFYCYNILNQSLYLEDDSYDIRSISLPCAGIMREIVMLRAFETGADAVVVFVCCKGDCDYVDGNIRAQKRVGKVKRILDEIGIGGGRLIVFEVPRGDKTAIESIVNLTLANLSKIEFRSLI